MKHIARLAACLLALAAALGLASCAAKGEETPNGMMIASCAGADYRLYVPNTWVLNTSYGVSGAYRDLARQSTGVGEYFDGSGHSLRKRYHPSSGFSAGYFSGICSTDASENLPSEKSGCCGGSKCNLSGTEGIWLRRSCKKRDF